MSKQIKHLNRVFLRSQITATAGFPDFLIHFLREGTAKEWLIKVNSPTVEELKEPVPLWRDKIDLLNPRSSRHSMI
jgi:hypothetical protein